MKTIAEIRKDGYLKRLLLLSIPIVLSNLISQLQMVIDRIFLGNYNDLYLSVLGNAMTPMWTTMSFCFSLATGASILVSQAVGAKNEDQIEEYVGALVKWNNVIPVFLFFFWLFGSEFVFTLMGVSENLMPMCVTYSRFYAPVFLLCGAGGAMTVILQTSNYTVPLVIYGVVRSALNIVLDYVLIFGKFGFPEWGIKGAAIETAIAEFIGAFVGIALVLFNKKLKTRPSLQGIWRAKLKPYIISAKLGLNTALEDFAWNIGNLVLIVILNTISEKAAGIYSIIFSIEILAVVFVGGVGGGTMTLTSESTGKRDVRQYRGITRCAYGVCLVVIVITLVACIVAPEQIIGMFTKDNETITTSGIFLLCMSINLFSKSGNIIVGNAIRGSGNTKWMFCTQVFGTCFVISLGCLFVFVFKLGILGVFLAVLLDEFVRILINLWKYFRIVGNANSDSPEWREHKENLRDDKTKSGGICA